MLSTLLKSVGFLMHWGGGGGGGGGGVKERLQRLLDPSQASDRFSTVLVYQRCRADRPGTIYMYLVHIMDMYMYSSASVIATICISHIGNICPIHSDVI